MIFFSKIYPQSSIKNKTTVLAVVLFAISNICLLALLV